MRTVDEVWVPTSWHTGVFSLGGIPAKKLFVLPEAIDLDFFTSSQRRPLVHSTTKQVDLPHSESRKTGLHRHRRGTRGEWAWVSVQLVQFVKNTDCTKIVPLIISLLTDRCGDMCTPRGRGR